RGGPHTSSSSRSFILVARAAGPRTSSYLQQLALRHSGRTSCRSAEVLIPPAARAPSFWSHELPVRGRPHTSSSSRAFILVARAAGPRTSSYLHQLALLVPQELVDLFDHLVGV